MAPGFEQRVRQLLDRALECPEAQRDAFVKSASAGDHALLEAVERLLREHASTHSFLQSTVEDSRRIGRYLIRGELGRGAMGIVYDAIDPMIGRRVAVKVISLKAGMEPSQAEFLKERLFREARSAGRLSHPGIVVIFDVGLEGDSAFITMERVDGRSLQQLLASGGALAPEVALSVLKQTAAALDYAHQLDVVHRDIKPANIMLDGGSTVKVADFGIAKLMSNENATVAGMIMGTPSYMSPEQIEARPVDGRSDQFSLAVMAYELLTGVRPFEADSIATMGHLIVYGSRPSAHAINAALPTQIDHVLNRALSRFPAQRFQTCTEFALELEKVVQRAIVAAKPVQTRNKRVARSLPYLAGIAALVIVALGLALTFGSHNAARTPAPAVTKPPAPSATPPVPPVQPRTLTAPQLIIARLGSDKVEPNAIEPNKAEPEKTVPEKIKTNSATPLAIKPKPIPASTKAQQLYSSAIQKREQGKSEEAVALFRQAADLGDTRAMKELAESYSTGEGVPKDGVEALRWFTRAAGGGNSEAMLSLGGLYQLGGDAVSQSDEEAARWFQKAADRKDPAGMYDLAMLYEEGQGVSRDTEKAKQLYREAAALGHAGAQRRLVELGIH